MYHRGPLPEAAAAMTGADAPVRVAGACDAANGSVSRAITPSGAGIAARQVNLTGAHFVNVNISSPEPAIRAT